MRVLVCSVLLTDRALSGLVEGSSTSADSISDTQVDPPPPPPSVQGPKDVMTSEPDVIRVKDVPKETPPGGLTAREGYC